MRKKKKDLDLSALEAPAPDFKQKTLDQFDTLGGIANWANARDVQTIAKGIFGLLLKAGAMKNSTAVVTEAHVRTVLDSMISERRQRQDAAAIEPSSLHSDMMAQMQNIQAPPPPRTVATSSSAINTSEAEAPPQLAKDTPPAAPANEIGRDSGVSDAVWEQLQRDKRAANELEEQYQKLIKASADAANNARILEQKEQAAEQALQQAIQYNKDQLVLQEAKRLREEARVRDEMERRAQEELLAMLERQRKAVEEERRKEARMQQKLRTLGICPAGFIWIRQDGGYRCSAGGHFVTDSALGL